MANLDKIESLIDDLLNQDQNIFGIAILNQAGQLVTQTDNWDISGDLDVLNELLSTKVKLGEKGVSSISIQGIKYMIVENTEERKIGTNIQGKGHLIVAPIPIGGTGALVCYINPQVGPRDALFTVQSMALKLVDLV